MKVVLFQGDRSLHPAEQFILRLLHHLIAVQCFNSQQVETSARFSKHFSFVHNCSADKALSRGGDVQVGGDRHLDQHEHGVDQPQLRPEHVPVQHGQDEHHHQQQAHQGGRGDHHRVQRGPVLQHLDGKEGAPPFEALYVPM